MINRVVLVGRLTKDIELRKTSQGVSTSTFTLACDRAVKKDGQHTADFIQCVAWRQSADFLGQYAKKGDAVAVDGHITTRNYEGQNGRVYVTEVNCESVRLISRKTVEDKTDETGKEKINETDKNSFYTENITEETDDLPFY